MDAAIIARVSEIILENQLGHKLPSRTKVQSKEKDSVQISSVASEARQIAEYMQNDDEKRAAKLEALKAKTKSHTYELSDEMVDMIAEKIATIFI